MFSIQGRWVVVAGLVGSAQLWGCSDDAGSTGGTAGSGTAGSTAGTLNGASGSGTAGSSGSASTAGSGGSAGAGTGGSNAGASTGGSAGASTAGSGGASGGSGGTTGGTGGAATGGTAGSGGASGGTGGTTGGSGGASGGGTGGTGGAAMPTAVAIITGLAGKTVTGTATFTQGATMTKLVLDLTACPDGVHSSHLHLMKDCGDNGNAAGGHWMPNGVGFGDYTCANGKGTLTLERPIATWTVGAPDASDVTKYAFMVHEAGDQNPGGRIGCGVVNKK